ncbi:MAG: hypothetical protein A2660_01805 [Candidatus Doudnabacteria bacterium RIFCSPHIGHO2_01_FULL_45_18]|uniref:PpiC domain-containing protein n=1 Tax=Candidatus Doudnabacteria bacterium RIFCSPHIGHO2_01_FULL_45_18 TaxID=1817823 RepID=A0A1F5NRW3_9BACT|nr:MAG: hypothetical protein A2660_01805 [Candidatus Doudnabacteria bacterium RIFCSPHIGHO2_01_FULL_45_18]
MRINFFIAILACAIFVFGLLYFTKALPVAIVGKSLISLNDWQENRQVAAKLDPTAFEQDVFDQFIASRQKQQLVDSLKISYESADFEDEFKFYTLGKSQEYEKLLQNYFSGSDKLFYKYVVVPQIHDALLQIKYNSDPVLNSDAYTRAINILAKIASGEKFEDLAKTESEDQVSGQLGGDLGFITQGQLLPELDKAVMQASLGQVHDQIVVSRLGMHILYPVETSEDDGQKVRHIKHILVQTPGYESWLEQNLQDIRVWRLIR